jgi:hypothetical protein
LRTSSETAGLVFNRGAFMAVLYDLLFGNIIVRFRRFARPFSR